MIFTIQIEITEDLLIDEAKEWLDNHFMSNRHFDICLINDLIKHLNMEGFRGSRVYTYLYSLHCVDFDKMKPATLAKVKEICYAMISKIEKPVEYEYEELV